MAKSDRERQEYARNHARFAVPLRHGESPEVIEVGWNDLEFLINEGIIKLALETNLRGRTVGRDDVLKALISKGSREELAASRAEIPNPPQAKIADG